MAAEDTERVSVSTYVPAYQRATWEAEAEAMDVSRSEYVRLMVQAGRRSFDLDSTASDSEPPTDAGSVSPESTNARERSDRRSEKAPEDGSDPRGQGLEERVLGLLDDADHLDWGELVAGLTEDIEARLEDTLEELQRENRVQYSGRHGGYTVVEDE